jgi:hypothetical protein
MQAFRYNIFSPKPLAQVFLIVMPKRVQKSNWGKIYDILSLFVLFSHLGLGHAIIVLLSQMVHWEKYGKRGNQIIFFPLQYFMGVKL